LNYVHKCSTRTCCEINNTKFAYLRVYVLHSSLTFFTRRIAFSYNLLTCNYKFRKKGELYIMKYKKIVISIKKKFIIFLISFFLEYVVDIF